MIIYQLCCLLICKSFVGEGGLQLKYYIFFNCPIISFKNVEHLNNFVDIGKNIGK